MTYEEALETLIEIAEIHIENIREVHAILDGSDAEHVREDIDHMQSAVDIVEGGM